MKSMFSEDDLDIKPVPGTSIKQEFINQQDILSVSVSLKSDSVRLGHPVASLQYWGHQPL